MEKTPNVFVTYGWCRSSYAVVASLARKGIKVHVGDASGLAMSRFSRYSKSFSKLPNFFLEPENYIDALVEAIERTCSDVLLPCHEDIGLISRYQDKLPSHIKVAVPDWAAYQLAEDKFALMNIAAKSGCPAPSVHEIESVQQLEKLAEELIWPVVIKTRIGNSAKGVVIASSKQELIKKFNNLIETYHLEEDRWPFIQEFLPGKAVGVCALYNRGQKVACFAEEYLRCKESARFGTSTLRKTYLDDQVVEQALSVLDSLKWHGLAHVDMIQDRNGVFQIIEINPRPWGAMALAVYAGIDFPWLWYQVATEQSTDNPPNPKDIHCRWLLGECMAAGERIKHGRFKEGIDILKIYPGCCHDDFSIRDPLPLLFEMLDYMSKFIRSGGSTNPVIENMVR
jgi:predicted ATP-grasp superfamily ATP-dependent carboligase